MPRNRRLLIPFLFSWAALLTCLTPPAMAKGIEILKSESWSFNTRIKNDLRLNVYALENSSWTADAIRDRLRFMNEALRSCGYEVSFVEFHLVSAEFSKVRVDDLDPEEAAGGMKQLSALGADAPGFRFYYFEDYVESFSSGGIFPVSIPEDSKVVQPLKGTAWFPLQTSAKRQKRSLPYSEEAHELGHLLLREGHDSSGDENILADNSRLRRNAFSPAQCARFRAPPPKKLSPQCGSARDALYPVFSRYYETYDQAHYMAQWCVRNSQNLYRALKAEGATGDQPVYAVYMIHREEDSSLKPRMARWNAESWSNHAFLLVDGLVLDQDFTDGPEIVPLAEYMRQMWGDRAKDYRFQVRDASRINAYTNLAVRESFAAGEYPTFGLDGFLARFSASGCAR